MSPFLEPPPVAVIDAGVAILSCARSLDPLDEGFVHDPELGQAACGDWCAGSRVEHAFASGANLAAAILEALGPFRDRRD